MVRVLGVRLMVVVRAGAGVWVSGVLPDCCGARQAPSKVETALARSLRSCSTPSGRRAGKNPFLSSLALLQESALHFLDHPTLSLPSDGAVQRMDFDSQTQLVKADAAATAQDVQVESRIVVQAQKHENSRHAAEVRIGASALVASTKDSGLEKT
jgi:hypothetical protein